MERRVHRSELPWAPAISPGWCPIPPSPCLAMPGSPDRVKANELHIDRSPL